VAALTDTVAPRGVRASLDASAAGTVDRVDETLGSLPWNRRRRIWLALWGLQLGAMLRPPFLPFSRLDRRRAVALVRRRVAGRRSGARDRLREAIAFVRLGQYNSPDIRAQLGYQEPADRAPAPKATEESDRVD
jgi:hypothetical protein